MCDRGCMKLFDLANLYAQLPQLISGIRLSVKKESAQDSATKLCVIDSDPILALEKTRSLLEINKLQGHTAESALTHTTWPR